MSWPTSSNSFSTLWVGRIPKFCEGLPVCLPGLRDDFLQDDLLFVCFLLYSCCQMYKYLFLTGLVIVQNENVSLCDQSVMFCINEHKCKTQTVFSFILSIYDHISLSSSSDHSNDLTNLVAGKGSDLIGALKG